MGDPFFYTVVVRTIVFTAVCVLATMILGTLVALLLNKLGNKMRLTVLLALLLAWATPAVTATQVFQFLFDTQFGVVNWALVSLGFEQFEGYSWLAEPLSLLSLAALIVVWAAIPFVALTLFAGLSQVPNEIYEAASLDGASRWTQFWRLTVPQLAPIFLILFALSTIWDFRVFTQVFILQKSGGIARDTDLLALYAYRTSFSANNFGVGSAIGVVMVRDAARVLRHLHQAHDQADRRGIMINRKGGLVANTLAIILVVVMVFPVYWMIISSFKPRADFFLETPKFLPIPATLDNYYRVINDKDFFNYAKNSLTVTVVVVVLSILVAFIAATAVARFNFKGRKAYIVMLLAVQMVPFEALLISMFVLLNNAGLVNQLTGVMVAYLAFVLPFTIWTLRGFIANVPKDLEEAAMIDGCSQGQAFRKILFPLIAPGLVSTSVFAFVLAWNEFILANVILLDQAKQTLPVWLTSFQGGQKAIDWGGLMAGSVLFAMPVIIFFVLVQGKIQRGALEGGVKG